MMVLTTMMFAVLTAVDPVRVALTFDDGLKDHLLIAAPELEKRGWRGTFNIVIDRIGTNGQYMTWDDVRELHRRGHEIATHTKSHPHLVKLLKDGKEREVRREIVQSRDIIADKTGFTPRFMCPPFVEQNEVTERICREEGLRQMLSCRHNFGKGDESAVTSVIADVRAKGARRIDLLHHGVSAADHGGWNSLADRTAFAHHLDLIARLEREGHVIVTDYDGMVSDCELNMKDWPHHGAIAFSGEIPGFGRGWSFSRDGAAGTKVDIPHDGAIGYDFDVKRWNAGCGALPYSGHGEYVKRLKVFPAGLSWRLEIDGAMSHAKVFVNGRKAAERPFGYSSFVVSLDGFLIDGENEFRITVDPPEDSSRWYPGFGIYRDIRLVSAPFDHVVPGSVSFVFSNVTAVAAEVTVGYEMSRSGPRRRTFAVHDPKLWSPESPHLYTVDLEGETFRYGIRTLRFDPTEGFFLNGQHRQMRGVCLHHDLGLFGAAFVREEARRRLSLLKEMGCDAIRTSHNPPSRAFLDLCDEMGFLVMVESFDEWKLPKVAHGVSEMWDAWHVDELVTAVRNARRHPSVVMWSIGNELREDNHPEHEAAGAEIARELVGLVRMNDPERRPVTAGHYVPATATNAIGAATDTFGGNYLPELYSRFRGRQGVVGTETCSTASSRGVYALQTTNLLAVAGQVLSYDLYPVWPNDYPPDVEFAAQEANPHCYGEFVWTGFDYIGEPDPWRKCARSSYFGIFDLAGFPKDRYWLYKSQWRPDIPSAHILPHWNWKEGDVVPVHVYSSGDEAELFVNGVSQGRRRRGKGKLTHRFVWDQVPYEQGEIFVCTWKKGVLWAEDRIRTSGTFARFAFHDEMHGDYVYRFAEAVDERGCFVPTAVESVPVEVPPGYRFIGACNGDATDLASMRAPVVRSFSGRALLVFRRDGSGDGICGGWMLSGEDIRGQGRLPVDVSCERCWETAGSDVTLRFDLRNNGVSEAIVEEGDYGFLFPFDSVFARGRKDVLDAACVAHVWCGGDVAWVWAGRPNGTNRYFSAVLTEGRLSSYSLHCDASRVPTGAYYRGSPVLNPPRLVIPPKGLVRFAFRISESSRRPDRDLMGPMLVTADDYSPSVGQEVVVRVRTAKGIREEKHRFDSPGEHVVHITEEGCKTFVRFNVLEGMDAILMRRAQFIVRRQQAGDDAGRLAGAYLIYDRTNGKTVVGETDHNGGRERLGMGAVIAVAARRSRDQELVQSLERHRAFVLRELFDAATCTVFNDVGRDNRWHRNYNYPWMSVYWLETWKLTHDLTHLTYAAGTLLNYYEKRGGKAQESPCLFVVDTIRALEEAGRNDEPERLRAALLAHADDILRRCGETHSVEVTVTHGGPNLRGSILSQAYELSHDVRYRRELEAELRRAESFYAFQPDARLCVQPVRHWDGFWFGGAQLYGDTFPQWLGALNGEMLWRAQRVLQRPLDLLWRTNLKGLLSAFHPDGFASCAYYPFKTETFVADSGVCAPFAPAGIRRGGFWDDWANDQDWSLYFAMRFLRGSCSTKMKQKEIDR